MRSVVILVLATLLLGPIGFVGGVLWICLRRPTVVVVHQTTPAVVDSPWGRVQEPQSPRLSRARRLGRLVGRSLRR